MNFLRQVKKEDDMLYEVSQKFTDLTQECKNILDKIKEYKLVLEEYSKPRLELIEWRPTDERNVEVLNETIDLYRFFDATAQAEFLCECVKETIDTILPEESNTLDS